MGDPEAIRLKLLTVDVHQTVASRDQPPSTSVLLKLDVSSACRVIASAELRLQLIGENGAKRFVIGGLEGLLLSPESDLLR